MSCVRWCTFAVGFFPAAEAAPKECDDEGVFLVVSRAVPASVKTVECEHASFEETR